MLLYVKRDAFCQIRGAASGDIGSPTDHPALHRGNMYEASFARSAAFHHGEYDIQTLTEIAVSPQDDVALRRAHISNGS